MITIESVTKVSPVKPKSQSFRTSVPREVIKALGLNKGDKMRWIITPATDEYNVAVVKEE